ncbi:uncharacterized protein LOC123504133 [Portunus trituberculatus]|uniref:uncharacterized protein LOC123504133 n=1 Tax=Portunus trituberculatus TaxID=210409 RepID=UPI001E1D1469|nr:uncharacterized protein LOC123504133 [Portunus trituberculatus]
MNLSLNYRDTQLLISEIERLPCLWDSSAEDYKNKIKKTKAWIKVYISLCPDYEDKTSAEKQQIGREIQMRWRNIRDSFMKDCKKFKTEHKSGTRPVKYRRYIFADQLSFLKKVGVEKIASNVPSTRVEDKKDNAAVNEATVQPKVCSKPMKKRKTISLEERMIRFLEDKEEEKDPDYYFFKSILPSVRALQEHQKLEFRMEVLKILHNFSYSKRPEDHTAPQTLSSVLTHLTQHNHSAFPRSHSRVIYPDISDISVPSTSGKICKTPPPSTPSPEVVTVATHSPASHTSDNNASPMSMHDS